MVNAHVAHDCHVGNDVILANNVMLAGHVSRVRIERICPGAAAVHQHCRVGACAMVGGQAHITKDVPPYVTVDGLSSLIVGLNVVGLRRGGFDSTELTELKAAYRVAFRSGLRWDDMLQPVGRNLPKRPGGGVSSLHVGDSSRVHPGTRDAASRDAAASPAGRGRVDVGRRP